MENVKLTFAPDSLKAISRKAIQRKTGARGLRAIMEGILLETMFDLPGMEGLNEVIINEDVVDNGKPPVLVMDKKKAAKAGN